MKRIVRRSLPWRVLKALHSPSLVLAKLVEITPGTPFALKCALDAFSRPSYAYGVVHGARLARRLGIPEISAIEFGVGNGDGLLALESLRGEIADHFGVSLRVYGFDLGEGLPPPVDFRDSPYLFKAGLYRMDEAALRRRLGHATLILGDVRDTTKTFFEAHSPPPIGFVALDMDYYSSTSHALRMLETSPVERLLPRTLCWVDDIVGPDEACHSELTGPLLAVNELNAKSEDRKIAKIHGLAHKRLGRCEWADQMYALHLFSHPRYDDFVDPEGDEPRRR